MRNAGTASGLQAAATATCGWGTLLATARLCSLFESLDFNAFGNLESASNEGVVVHGTFFLSKDLPKGTARVH